jgi:hypothetical protein
LLDLLGVIVPMSAGPVGPLGRTICAICVANIGSTTRQTINKTPSTPPNVTRTGAAEKVEWEQHCHSERQTQNAIQESGQASQ